MRHGLAGLLGLFGTATIKQSVFWRKEFGKMGHPDKYLDDVKSIQVGDRIAIKSAYTKKRNLPFDNQGKDVSTMAIKATGYGYE